MVNGDDSFKRPGAVPFNWEIRPGVPKTQPDCDDDVVPTLIQPPKKLLPLRLKPFSLSPSPSLSSSSSSYIYDSKSRPASPFAPPSSFKLKKSPSSRPLTPFFRSASTRGGLEFVNALPHCFPKSLFGSKKSKNDDVKKTSGQVSSSSPTSSTSESDNFYASETTFTPSEDSSQRSVSTSSTRWSSPKSSLSSSRSLRGSPLRRNKSDLSSYLKRKIPF